MAFLRAAIPVKHPSASVLGEERMGAGVAVTSEHLLTAHYLVLGASRVDVTGLDGKARPAARASLDHDSGLALLTVEGAAFEPVPASERHAWIGFYPQANEDGIAISGVVSGGPADSAGLQRGDLLLTVDGQPVRDLRQLYRALWRKGPGETVGMQVLREESIHVIEVVAGDRDEFYK